MISNAEIAAVLWEISQYLEMEGVAFKPRAYEKVAEVIEGLSEELRDLYKKGGLKAIETIPGIGVSIGEKIEELITTGKCKEYEQLKKKTPVDLAQLSKVGGLGPKKIKKLYDKLKITNLTELGAAAKKGKIAVLEGFGEKSEEKIVKALEFLSSGGNRFVLPYILPDIWTIRDYLKKLKEVEELTVAGSVRRYKETIGDADMLVVSKQPKKIMDAFTTMPGVVQVLAHGETKSAVKMKNGLQVDVRVLPKESYGAALNYFTGSKDHNVALRQLAIKKGYTLNEYGLWKGTAEKKGKMIAGATEAEIYKALGLLYIEPELREMTGEIEAAAKGKLPDLIGYGDLKGDLQVQTNWTDGAKSIEEMAVAAMAAGLEYIAITDHTKRLAMVHGLDEKRLAEQGKEIDELNRKFQVQGLKFKVLKGTECDILEDGKLDLSDEALAKLDIVGVSVHSYFNLSHKDQTARIKRAIQNLNVDMFFHPTGRVVGRREPYDVDIEELIATAKATGTIMEINGSDRLDLKDQHIRLCVEAGVKMAVNSDAHNDGHYGFMEFGISQARRGWAEKKDIINAWPLEKMLSFLKK